MTRKVYRTAQGKMVDLGALQLRNENVRAVGNMNVNARGDLIDSANQPIDTRNRQVARQYRRQVTNVTSAPIRSSQQDAMPAAPTVPKAPEDFQDDFEKLQAPQAASTPAAGLAAAIARAREIRQDPLKTHQSIAEHQSQSGKS